MTNASSTDILIIGAGFSGMCAAILGRQAGLSVLMLEKGADVGGVWRENTYPGAACDVPWHLYSYSFFKEVIFSRPYPQQAELLSYQQDCARHYGLYECTRFGVEVASADWDESAAHWTVTDTDGKHYTARALISSVGLLSRPAWPQIPGRESFSGAQFHSAEWDHSVDLTGKRVGVIGTGASAIQFIPEVAKVAGQLTVFQRSAPYCLPRFDEPYGAFKQWYFKRVPGSDRPMRYGIWKFGETLGKTFEAGEGRVSRLTRWATRKFLESQVKDPELRKKLTPEYAIGCKRILFTSNYFPTYERDNVSLHVDGIAKITESGVVDKHGVEHALDVLIFGTGFKATEYLAPMKIHGTEGRELHETWGAKVGAYLGMTVPHFPNFFMMYGPNTNLGGNSIIFMIECQARYIIQALQALKGHKTIKVREEPFAAFNQEMQDRLKNMAWASGCTSWYQTADGHNPTNWPGPTAEYRERTAAFDAADYELA